MVILKAAVEAVERDPIHILLISGVVGLERARQVHAQIVPLIMEMKSTVLLHPITST